MKTQGFRLVQGVDLPPRLPPSSTFSIWAKRGLVVGALYALGYVVASFDGAGYVTAESLQLQMWKRLQLAFTDPHAQSPERKLMQLPQEVRGIGEKAVAAEAARMADEDAYIQNAVKLAKEAKQDPSFWASVPRMTAAVEDEKKISKLLYRRAVRHANLSSSFESLHVGALIERQRAAETADRSSFLRQVVEEAQKQEKVAIGRVAKPYAEPCSLLGGWAASEERG